MSAAPIVVKEFQGQLHVNDLGAPLVQRPKSIAEDHECSTGAQSPSTVASAWTGNEEESVSSEADSRSSQVETSTMYTMGHERVALGTSMAESLYKSFVMVIENVGANWGRLGWSRLYLP